MKQPELLSTGALLILSTVVAFFSSAFGLLAKFFEYLSKRLEYRTKSRGSEPAQADVQHGSKLSQAVSDQPRDLVMSIIMLAIVVGLGVLVNKTLKLRMVETLLFSLILYVITVVRIARKKRQRELKLIQQYSCELDKSKKKNINFSLIDFLMVQIRSGENLEVVLQANLLMDYLIDKQSFINKHIASFSGRKRLAKMFRGVANEALYKYIRNISIDALIETREKARSQKDTPMPTTVAALTKEMKRRVAKGGKK